MGASRWEPGGGTGRACEPAGEGRAGGGQWLPGPPAAAAVAPPGPVWVRPPSGEDPAASIPGMASAGKALACLGSPAPRPQGAPSVLRCPIFPVPTCPPPLPFSQLFSCSFPVITRDAGLETAPEILSSAPSVSPIAPAPGPPACLQEAVTWDCDTWGSVDGVPGQGGGRGAAVGREGPLAGRVPGWGRAHLIRPLCPCSLATVPGRGLRGCRAVQPGDHGRRAV